MQMVVDKERLNFGYDAQFRYKYLRVPIWLQGNDLCHSKFVKVFIWLNKTKYYVNEIKGNGLQS